MYESYLMNLVQREQNNLENAPPVIVTALSQTEAPYTFEVVTGLVWNIVANDLLEISKVPFLGG